MLRLNFFFWYSDILTDLHSHLQKKKAEFWNFYLKFLQILEFQMWIFGRKFGRSVKNFGQKYSSVLYANQNNFELNTIIAKVANVKKPYPLKRVWGGGGVSVLLVTYPSNPLTCLKSLNWYMILSFFLFCIIWDKDLTEGEIFIRQNKSWDHKTAYLIAFWDCNEGQGEILKDL